MIWLTWRQVRTQLVAAIVLVAAAALVLATTGPGIAHLAATSTHVYDLLSSNDLLQFNAGVVVMAVVPALLGVFWGAPLVARELESGTYRLAWNQSVTRTRWLASKLAFATIAVAFISGAVSLAVTWWANPLDGAQGAQRNGLPSRMTPVSFAMRGIVPVGYAVFALVLGVAIGLVLRRTVPAMAITFALYVVAQVVVPLWIRPHLIPPVTETITLSQKNLDGIAQNSGGGPLRITAHTANPNDWILDNVTWTSAGKPGVVPTWLATCPHGAPDGSGVSNTPVPAVVSVDPCLTRLAQAGYRQHVVYQPASRFWDLQWAETGLYLAGSALLSWFCFWWTRRKLS